MTRSRAEPCSVGVHRVPAPRGVRRRRPTAGRRRRRQGPVRLLTHDSFLLSDGVLDAFTEETGIEVEVHPGRRRRHGREPGDPHQRQPAGRRAVRHRLHVPLPGARRASSSSPTRPTGSTRSTRRSCSTPSTASRRSTTATCASTTTRPTSRSTTCAVPTSLDDLTDPAYADLLVVENPATSSPGLAFLLATVEAFGEDGWEEWWSDLRDNGVRGGRRLGGGVLLVVLRRAGQRGRPAARRVLRVEPAGRGASSPTRRSTRRRPA